MDKLLLKSIMTLNGDTIRKLSEEMKITPQTFTAKLNERGGAEFRQSEICFIKSRYHLTPDEIDRIFFGKKVS